MIRARLFEPDKIIVSDLLCQIIVPDYGGDQDADYCDRFFSDYGARLFAPDYLPVPARAAAFADHALECAHAIAASRTGRAARSQNMQSIIRETREKSYAGELR